MIGYCPKCKEYRSDNGSDAWGFVWKDGMPICRRCNHFVDLLDNKQTNAKGKNNCGLYKYVLTRQGRIYPNNGRPEKHPRLLNAFALLMRKLAEVRKNRGRNGKGEIEKDRKSKEKQTTKFMPSISFSHSKRG